MGESNNKKQSNTKHTRLHFNLHIDVFESQVERVALPLVGQHQLTDDAKVVFQVESGIAEVWKQMYINKDNFFKKKKKNEREINK